MTIPSPADAAAPVSLAEALARLRPHPRLILDDDGARQVLELVSRQPRAGRELAALRGQADALLAEPATTYGFPDGRTLLRPARQVLARVVTLGLVHRLTSEPGYAERAWAELAAAADFPDWNPSSFLSTAELLQAVALGYDWLYDVLDHAQREKLRTALIAHGLRPALRDYRDGTRWTWVNNNWNTVCNAGVILGALAVADSEPTLAHELIERALASLPAALEEFTPDGGYAEGPGYWGYAMRYLVSAVEGLRTAVGTDLGLTSSPGLRETGEYRLHMTGPTGRTYNVADTVGEGWYAPVHWLAAWYQDETLARWISERADPESTEAVLHLIGRSRSATLAGGGEDPPRDKLFTRTRTFLTRSGWDPDALYVGFTAGDNDANHNDLDLGSFILEAGGVRWAVDLGPEDYGLPGYWDRGPSGARWQYYRKRAEGHNTLVPAAPTRGPDQDPAAAGRITSTRLSDADSLVVADLTTAYAAAGISRWQRTIGLVDGRSACLVEDEVAVEKPVELQWQLHTTAAVTPSADGAGAVLAEGGRELLLRAESPALTGIEVLPAAPGPGSPRPERQTPNEGVRKLILRLRAEPAAEPLKLTVRMTPG